MSACFEASCRDVAGLAELDDARQTFPEGMSNSPSANVGDGRVLGDTSLETICDRIDLALCYFMRI